jgi:lipopolysaccharide/colanic/teichoic acid biosynthesis glycosyltransferase
MKSKSLNITGIVEKGALANNTSGLYIITKRMFDIIMSMIGVILISPLLFIILVILICSSREPVFIALERLGFKGRVFKIYNFYSSGPTWINRTLNRTRLNGLPQIFNVLKGDMSIVGPQPGNAEKLYKYNDWHTLVMSAKPGTTGLWRIRGVNRTDFEEIARLDMKYIRERSFMLDMDIILKSISRLIVGKRRS